MLKNMVPEVTRREILDKLEAFFNSYKQLKAKAGMILLRPNDPLNNIYYIKSGQMRLYSLSEEGQEVTLHIARPGSFFPMMLVLGKATKNNYFVQAQSEADLRVAAAEEVINFLKSDPEVLFDLTERFAAGICGLMLRIEYLLTNTSRDNIRLILDYLADRFGEKTPSGKMISLPLTHTAIGSWLGINRETVTRQLKKLQQQGVIDYHKQYLLVKNQDIIGRYGHWH